MQCPRCQHENPTQAKFCLERHLRSRDDGTDHVSPLDRGCVQTAAPASDMASELRL